MGFHVSAAQDGRRIIVVSGSFAKRLTAGYGACSEVRQRVSSSSAFLARLATPSVRGGRAVLGPPKPRAAAPHRAKTAQRDIWPELILEERKVRQKRRNGAIGWTCCWPVQKLVSNFRHLSFSAMRTKIGNVGAFRFLPGGSAYPRCRMDAKSSQSSSFVSASPNP